MSKVRFTHQILEVVQAFTPPTKTVTSGAAAVTQQVMEVVMTIPATVRVTQQVMEVVLSDSETPLDPPDEGGGGSPTSYPVWVG